MFEKVTNVVTIVAGVVVIIAGGMIINNFVDISCLFGHCVVTVK